MPFAHHDSRQPFQSATSLKPTDDNGIKDELPPITTFPNRLLALTIELQCILFTAFEQFLDAKVAGADFFAIEFSLKIRRRRLCRET
jgi:hypothetical protein